MITINGKEFRNLVEQVLKNKEDIKNYHNLEQVLADWGIKVLGQLDEWEEPTGSFEFGDAYAVGTEPPYDYYIYTRRGENEGYWFNNGPISIVGPAGPAGESIVGPRGEDGSQIYFGSNFPTGEIRLNDMYINTTYDLFTYNGTEWVIKGNIKGAPGANGVSITGTEIVDGNLIIRYSNGQSTNVGQVVGANGQPGQDGSSLITDIIGTVDSEDELATTFPVEEQAVNAGVLVKIAGLENEYNLYIIIDDVWTNTGRYGGGSTVYSGGQYQQVFNADTKLDKVTSSGDWRVYSITSTGEQSTQGFGSTQLEPGVIVSRRAGGHVIVPEAPLSDDTEYQNQHAVSYGWATRKINDVLPNTYSWAAGDASSKTITYPIYEYFKNFIGQFSSATGFGLPVVISYHNSANHTIYTLEANMNVNRSARTWNIVPYATNGIIVQGTFTSMNTQQTGQIIFTGFTPSSNTSFILQTGLTKSNNK